MRLNILLLGFIFSAATFLVMAGNDHGHDHGHEHSQVTVAVDAITAKSNATNIIAELVNKEKLVPSWLNVTASSTEKKEFKGTLEWVVIFENDKITDASKQTLYIFLKVNGEYIAANYTGQ